MTGPCGDPLEAYSHGLDVELSILDSLVRLAAAQDAASASGDTEALLVLLGQRASTLATLEDAERDLAGRRVALSSQLTAIRPRVPGGLDHVREQHRLAADRLAQIDAHDRRTLEQLARTEPARRDSSQMLDAAEATLAAYRKTIAPSEYRSGLIDRRG